jgi:hypothetical protein
LVAAFAINELSDRERERVGELFAAAAERGTRVLVVEPVAKWAAPWWERWRDRFAGRARDEVTELSLELPELLCRLDAATGLCHRRFKVRALWVGP